MSVTWLHVSDFHVRAGDSYDRHVVLRALVDSVRRLRERDGRVPDLVFATGDVAHAGKAGEYALATRFFDELLEAAGVGRERLFVIPGNHDVDRDEGLALLRTLDSREQSDAFFRPGRPILHLAHKLGAFVEWHDGYFAGIRKMPVDSTCGPVEVVEVRGVKVGVLPVNSALFCQGDDDHGKLWVGRRALDAGLEALRGAGADLNVALVHHPLEWLSDWERSNVKAALQGGVDVVLRGHLHETDVESVVAATGGALHVAAGAAYQTRRWPNRAVFGTFDGQGVSLFPIRYEDSPTEVWTTDPSVFPTERGHERRFVVPRLAAKEAPSAAPASAAASAKAPEPVVIHAFRSNIPKNTLPFVGRDELLKQIEASLNDPATPGILVLHGQPGVGKSELAREFARRSLDRFPGGTFFIDAGSGAELVDLARIGKTQLGLEFPPDFSLRDQCERTLVALGNAPVLLVYDNAHSPESVEPWLPRVGMPCQVLITSVSENWGPGWPMLEVKPLAIRTSLELIERLAGAEVAAKHGKALAEMADGLPVQICPAATTLAYEARRGRLDSASLKPTSEAHDSFRLVYERLEPPVQLLLHVAAFLNEQRIPRVELQHHIAQGAGWDDAEFNRRLDVCQDLHLLEGGAELRMHQLFAAFLMGSPVSGWDKKTLEQIRYVQKERFIELAKIVGENPADSETAAAVLAYPLSPEAWEGTGTSLTIEEGESVGQALWQIGRFGDALPWGERAVEEKQKGDVQGRVDHASLGSSLHQVGVCLSSQGKYAEALPWYERAVEEKQKGGVHGRVNHASLGSSLHQVGGCLSSQGKYAEALPWYERAVEEKQKGDIDGRVDHDSLGVSLHQVGYCLSSQGKNAEVLPLYERAVEEKQKGDVHGRVNHASLGISLHEVGVCLSRQGKYADALPWYERAVEAAQRGDVHGRVGHGSLGRSMAWVGSCLSALGRFSEALVWHQRAVAAKQMGDVYGRVNYESLGVDLHLIGELLSHEEKYAEALPWYERAVEAAQKGDLHGRVDHESLGRSLHRVADSLSRQGDIREAVIRFELAVEAKRKGNIFGTVDQQSLSKSLREGASYLRTLGREEEAQQWEEEADRLAE